MNEEYKGENPSPLIAPAKDWKNLNQSTVVEEHQKNMQIKQAAQQAAIEVVKNEKEVEKPRRFPKELTDIFKQLDQQSYGGIRPPNGAKLRKLSTAARKNAKKMRIKNRGKK